MRDEFMITRQGKQYVLFAGLLDEAHTRGLKGIDTELLQVPDEANGNMAVIKAVVEMEDGRVFTGIGDASPNNVGRAISPHLIRMAETRAKARALRDAVNVGATALEELSDGDDAPPSPERRPAPVREMRPEAKAAEGQTAKPRPRGRQAQAGESEDDSGERNNGSSGKSSGGRSDGQRKASRSNKARKSQVDLLKTLLVEARGEDGVEKMENHLGREISDLTREEADSWIDRLTPEDGE